jgi:hypothetical protein
VVQSRWLRTFSGKKTASIPVPPGQSVGFLTIYAAGGSNCEESLTTGAKDACQTIYAV